MALGIDLLFDAAFLAVSVALSTYSLYVLSFMRKIRYYPSVIRYVTATGTIAVFASIAEMAGDLFSSTSLEAIHALGMLLMSSTLLLGVRRYLQMLRGTRQEDPHEEKSVE